MDNTPEELLRRIASGSEADLEAFYRQFETTVYRFALSRLNDSFDASDVLNEVMMEVWRHAGRFQGRSKVSTWLLGITHHKVIDRIRKRGSRTMTEVDPQLPDSKVNIESAIAGAQDADLVAKCMKGLSDDHRQVLHLAFFEDTQYGEIAEILDCPEGTVKSRVYHAKEAIKRCLSKLMPVGGRE